MAHNSIAFFDPGDRVWFWSPSMREPEQVTVDDVCIWINERGTNVSYSFRENLEGHPAGMGRVSDLFATREQAEEYRCHYIKQARASMVPADDR